MEEKIKSNLFHSLCKALNERTYPNDTVDSHLICFFEELDVQYVPYILAFFENTSLKFELSARLNYKVAYYYIEKKDDMFREYLDSFLNQLPKLGHSIEPKTLLHIDEVLSLSQLMDGRGLNEWEEKLNEIILDLSTGHNYFDSEKIATQIIKLKSPNLLHKIMQNFEKQVHLSDLKRYKEEAAFITLKNGYELSIYFLDITVRLIHEDNLAFVKAIDEYVEKAKRFPILLIPSIKIEIFCLSILIKIKAKNFNNAKTELIALVNLLNSNFPIDKSIIEEYQVYEIMAFIEHIKSIPNLLDGEEFISLNLFMIELLRYHRDTYEKFPFSMGLKEYIDDESNSYWSKRSIIARGMNQILEGYPIKQKLGIFLNACGHIDYHLDFYYKHTSLETGLEFIFDVFGKDLEKLMKYTIEIKGEFDKKIIKTFKHSLRSDSHTLTERYELLENILKFLVDKYLNQGKLIDCQHFIETFLPSEPVKKIIDEYIEERGNSWSINQFEYLHGNGRSMLEQLINEKLEEHSKPEVPVTEIYNEQYFDYYTHIGDLERARNEIKKIKDMEEYIKEVDSSYFYSNESRIRIANMLLLVREEKAYLKVMKKGEALLDYPLGDKLSRGKPERQLDLINDYIKNGFLLEATSLLTTRDYTVYRSIEIDHMAITKEIAKGFNTITSA